LAERLIRSSHSDIRRGYWDRHLEFLFADAKARDLAMRFWPQFSALAGSEASPYEKVPVLWAYLSHAYPSSTPEMFVEVYRKVGGKEILQNSASSALDPLPPDGEFAVIDAVITELDGLLEKGDPEAKRRGYSVWQLDRDALFFRQLAIRCDGAANKLVAYVASVDNPRMKQFVTDWVAHTRPHMAVLRGLTTAEDPELRRMAVGAARNDPTPAYRQIMAELEDDPDERVRAAVTDDKATHREWLQRPLPHSGRRLPTR
jgi:hypothetical protein